MNLSAALHRTGYYITLGVFFLLPLFFLPSTSEFYDFNKQALLIVSSLISLIVWTISFVVDRQVRVTRSPFGVPLLLFALFWIASTLFRSPNRVDGLFEVGQTASILSLVILFFTSINFIKTRKQLEALVSALLLSLSVMAGLAALWGTGLMDKIIPVAFMKNPLWTTTGNPLTTLTLMLSAIPFVGLLIIREKAGTTKTLLLSIALFLFVISSGIVSYRLFSANSTSKPVFLTQQTSWSIALEALKVSPLLGTGPATYLEDFTRFKPTTYNLGPNWAIRFSSSSNYYLQLLTLVGILGLAAYLLIVYRTFRMFTKSLKTNAESPLNSLAIASTLTLLVIFTAQLFVPTSLVWMSFIFSLLVIAVTVFKQLGSSLIHEANVDIIAASEGGHRSPILPVISLVFALLLALPGLYLTGVIYYADHLFQKALIAAASNDGRKTYETLIEAIKVNPYKDAYRVAYSQTNLLLANSLAAKQDITTEERTTITTLAQQAIREAKNAVALNPNKVTNVENLAGIYRNLLNVAEGADVWTLASYQQAIRLDPTNPSLRLSLGGLYFAAKNYDQAIALFEQSVGLKPDYANAYYNLSVAYREKGDTSSAIAAMERVINLVDKTSADYTKAQSELEELKKTAGQNASATPIAPAESQLEEPQPLPTPRINPPIQLPADSGPETTPAPTETPTPTPTITVPNP